MFLTGRHLFDGRTPHVHDDWMIEVDGERIVCLLYTSDAADE